MRRLLQILHFTARNPLPSLILSALIITTALFLNGCRKSNEDSSSPKIHFLTPAAGSVYYYNYSFQVRAHVTDNIQLKSIAVEITNSAGQVFLQSESLQNLGTSYELTATFSHNDIYLSSGIYYIRITASDGENTAIDFREIQLYEAPRLLNKIIAVRCGFNGCTLDSLFNGQLHTFMNLTGDYMFGGIDSRINQFNWTTTNPTAGTMWLYPDLVPNSDFSMLLNSEVTAFFHDEDYHEFYIGCLDGVLLKASEQLVQQFANFGQVKIIHLLTTENYVFVITQASQTVDTYIHVVNRTTGSLIQSLPLGFEIKGITALENENKLLLAGNESGNSLFKIYNLQTNALNAVFNFYDNTIVYGLWPADEGNFYIAHDAGIGFYTGYLNSYVIHSTLIPNKMIYEDITGVVYVLTNDGLFMMNQDCSTELQFVASPDLSDLWLKYNK